MGSCIYLYWMSGQGATSYNVYRGTAAGQEAAGPVATNVGGASGCSWTDNAAQAGTTYYYTVTSVNSAGESAPSSEANTFIPLPTTGSTTGSTSGYPGGGYPPSTTGGMTNSGTTGTTTSTGTTGTGTTGTGTTGTTTGPAAGTASIHVIWPGDCTTVPSTLRATPDLNSASGSFIAGACTIHISLPVAQNTGELFVKELRIHEGAGHYNDIVITNPAMNGQPSSLCGDPAADPTNSAPMKYYDTSWDTTPMHNGPHTITALVESCTIDPATNQYGPASDSQLQLSVDVENVLITSTAVNTNYGGTPAAGAPGNSNTDNPKPILWDPGSMESVTLSAPITAAYRGNQQVTLWIYSSDQSLVKTMTQTVTVGGINTDPGPPPTSSLVATKVTFNWDGAVDAGSSGGYLGSGYPSSGYPSSGYPGGSSGGYPGGMTSGGGAVTSAKAEKGVYLYKFQAHISGGSFDDGDQDKSSSLTFGSPATSLAPGTSDAAGTTYALVQTLQDSFNNPAASCRVDVYENWSLDDVLTQPTSTNLGTTTAFLDAPPPSKASVDDMVRGCKLVFLVSPRDADLAHDRGHRNRYTLQHNLDIPQRTLMTFGGYYPPAADNAGWAAAGDARGETVSAATAADGLATTLKYHDWAVRGNSNTLSSGTDPTPSQILFDQWATPEGVLCPHGAIQACVDVAIFCGHGPAESDSGTAFMFGTEQKTTMNDDTNYFLESSNDAAKTSWKNVLPYNDAAKQFSSLDMLHNIWNKVYTTRQAVRLVIWAGCDTAHDWEGNGMPANTVLCGGAICSVGFQTPWRLSQVQAFSQYLDWEDMRKESVWEGVTKSVSRAKCGRRGPDYTHYCGIAGNSDIPLPY